MGGRLRRGDLTALARLPRARAYGVLARLQRRRWYRPLARRLTGPLDAREATMAEDREVRERWPREGHAASGPHSQVTTYVALAGERVVGWCYLQRNDEDTVFPGYVLAGIYVRARHRGLGLARQLMHVLIDCAAHEGALDVLLVVDEANMAAINLYASMGFTVAVDPPWTTRMEEVQRRYGVRRVVMRMPLRG
jgi:L-amino acid N-acyltransferase YncA